MFAGFQIMTTKLGPLSLSEKPLNLKLMMLLKMSLSLSVGLGLAWLVRVKCLDLKCDFFVKKFYDNLLCI